MIRKRRVAIRNSGGSDMEQYKNCKDFLTDMQQNTKMLMTGHRPTHVVTQMHTWQTTLGKFYFRCSTYHAYIHVLAGKCNSVCVSRMRCRAWLPAHTPVADLRCIYSKHFSVDSPGRRATIYTVSSVCVYSTSLSREGSSTALTMRVATRHE